MKILHIGGYNFVTRAFAKQQAALGHEVKVLPARECPHIFETGMHDAPAPPPASELAKQKYDVIHFHLAESLNSFADGSRRSVENALKILSRRGAKLFFYSYDRDPLLSALSAGDQDDVQTILREHFVHILLGAPGDLQLLPKAVPWSWLAVPLDVQPSSPAAVQPGHPGELSFLHVSNLCNASDSRIIEQLMQQLRNSGHRLVFRLQEARELQSWPRFFNALAQCDVYIEKISGQTFGLPALLAMACGKTVISANTAGAKELWEQLALCPVLDADQNTLERRVVSILREPKCLRDLRQRSRHYAETFHNPAVVTQILLDLYRRKG